MCFSFVVLFLLFVVILGFCCLVLGFGNLWVCYVSLVFGYLLSFVDFEVVLLILLLCCLTL